MPSGCTSPTEYAAALVTTVRYGPRKSVTTVVENAEFAKSYRYHPRCSFELYSVIRSDYCTTVYSSRGPMRTAFLLAILFHTALAPAQSITNSSPMIEKARYLQRDLIDKHLVDG